MRAPRLLKMYRRRLNWLSLVLLSLTPAYANTQMTPINTEPSTGSAALAQLEAGEYRAALALAQAEVAAIEASGTNYDRPLVEPLTVIGDAYLQLDDAPAAMQAYERARYVVRMNDGLDAASQVGILHREARAFVKMGNHTAANDRYETAYLVRLKHLGHTLELVPGQIQLADWYRSNRQLGVAMALYRDSMDLIEQADPVNERLRAQLHRKIGLTYREYRWPAKGQRTRFITPKPGGRMWHDPSLVHRNLNEWRRHVGTKALKRATASLRETDAGAGEIVNSILELADSLMMYRIYRQAFEHYESAYELAVADAPQLVDALFERPKLLFQPHPGSLRDASTGRPPVPGRIEFSVSVDRKGRVRNIKTVHVEPKGVLVFPYRRAVRNGRYRPALRDGKSVDAHNIKAVFKFQYYP